MIPNEQLSRLQMMEATAPVLHRHFCQLTCAHLFFQGSGKLTSVSVSDLLDNNSIEATFVGTRIKFELVMIFGSDRQPRGRVVCMHCRPYFGEAMQVPIGSFTFDEQGVTDLPPDANGAFPGLESDSPAIIMHYLDAAFSANKTL